MTGVELTQEQIDELILRSGPLTVTPLPWLDLDEATQNAFRLLRTVPFTPVRRQYLNLWWLAASEQIIEDLNELAPANFRISGREALDGVLYVGGDLLTDAIDYGPLHALQPILETLPITYRLPEHWPAPPEEGEE